jgi:hypothetical protein
MLNSGKKICALRDKKNKYSNSRFVRKKNSERNKITISPPLQVKWSLKLLLCSYVFSVKSLLFETLF